MTETGVSIAGSVVSIIVFTGGFLYAMLSFGRWADTDEAKGGLADEGLTTGPKLHVAKARRCVYLAPMDSC